MDGLKGVVPGSCRNGIEVKEKDLFGEKTITIKCEGCNGGDIRKHNGKYCYIRKWTDSNSEKDRIRFIDLIKQH